MSRQDVSDDDDQEERVEGSHALPDPALMSELRSVFTDSD